jgi:anti-sigma factor RsiW
MIRFRDEVLVAYADGELSQEMRRIVERALNGDAHARQSVAQFQLSAHGTRLAFAGIDYSGVPAWLARPGAQVRKAHQWESAFTSRPGSQRLGRMAALAGCLLIGFGIGMLVHAGTLAPIRSEANVDAARAATSAPDRKTIAP